MSIGMSPWVPAVLIELCLVSAVLAVFFQRAAGRVEHAFKRRIRVLEEALEEAKAETRRIEEEALRKRKIITFDVADLEALKEAGEIAGDGETIESLKTRIVESADVLGTMQTSAGGLNQKLSEVMEKQMVAVNMVGRLGGTGGLPPEVKEKAEAILDVFRTIDEILSGAFEEVDQMESGLGEVAAVVADFKEADPSVKLPTAELLNETLKKKSGDSDVDAAEPSDTVAMDAFDTPESEELRA